MSDSHGAVPPADADLLQRAAAGDKESFGILFERYQHIVYRFAKAMTGSAEVAEDVTQEVFVVLMRDLRRYAPERARFSTYLYGIARNLSRDRLRRDRRLESLLALGNTAADESAAIDPFVRLVMVETTADVRRALADVPVRYREVMILCDLHELSYADVADILGTSVAAVRSRLHRGRQFLRQRLAPSVGRGMRWRLPVRHSV